MRTLFTLYRIQGDWQARPDTAPVPEGLHHEGDPRVVGELLHQLRVVLVSRPGPHQGLDLVHADGDVGVADHADQGIHIPIKQYIIKTLISHQEWEMNSMFFSTRF